MREIGLNLLFAHAPGEVFKHVINGDPRSLDARPAAPHMGVDDNPILPVHHHEADADSRVVATKFGPPRRQTARAKPPSSTTTSPVIKSLPSSASTI